MEKTAEQGAQPSPAQPTSHLSARKQEVAALRAERERQARAARDWAVQTKQEAERRREANRRRTAARLEAARASARAEEAQRERERESFAVERRTSATRRVRDAKEDYARRQADACERMREHWEQARRAAEASDVPQWEQMLPRPPPHSRRALPHS